MSRRLLLISTLLCILCFAHIPSGDTARILGLFLTFSKSHLIVHSAITDALAEAGHDVTVVTTIPLIKKNPRYRHVQLKGPPMGDSFMSTLINNPPPIHKRYSFVMDSVINYTNTSMNQPEMKRMMEEESFDVVLLGYFFNELLLGVASAFKCPVIVTVPVRPFTTTNVLIGNPLEVAYVPGVMVGAKQPLGFFNRVKSFLAVNLIERLTIGYISQQRVETLYKENFPPDKFPSFDDMKKNVSLILTNHHFSQTPIRPNVPAVIEIGGIQIKEKPDPLPEKFKAILDKSSKHGVIYFSLGSNVQGIHLKQDKVKIMFDVLSKLPQTILWKWGDQDQPGQSPNIIYSNWFPQDDILAHPNVKLFITHGGMGSVVESQYHAVPMVGIPLFAEQHSNMKNVVTDGFGLSVDYHTLEEDEFKSKINQVLSNPKYSENVARFARLYKDRPMSAKETAVYWVEYVIRHRGAPHMQSPAVHLNFLQLMSLDVIGFLLAVVYIVYKVIRVAFRLIFRRKSSKAKKE